MKQAESFVAELDAERGSTDRWDIPTEHPFDNRAAVAWCDGYLAAHAHLLDGRDTLTPEQTRTQGWNFHPFFKGSFAKARFKLEEAQLLLDGLKLIQCQPNFPAYTALFSSFLSALYAVMQALSKACEKLGPAEKDWLDSQFKKIKDDPIVGYFYKLNNDQKHDLKSSPLHVSAKVSESKLQSFPGPVMVSAEGAFGIANVGTPQERRIPLVGLNSQMTVQVLSADGSLLGDAINLSEYVLRFYEEMTFAVRQQFDRYG